jgi:hypothetical protein
VIDVARRKGKTSADVKRLARDRMLSGNGTRTRRCKAIGIDDDHDEEEEGVFLYMRQERYMHT